MKIIPHDFPPIFEDKLNNVSISDRDLIGRLSSLNKSKQLEISPIKGDYDAEHLKKIHHHLFNDVSSYAGRVRGYTLKKEEVVFAGKDRLETILNEEIPSLVKELGDSKNNQGAYVYSPLKKIINQMLPKYRARQSLIVSLKKPINPMLKRILILTRVT